MYWILCEHSRSVVKVRKLKSINENLDFLKVTESIMKTGICYCKLKVEGEKNSLFFSSLQKGFG